MDKYIAVEAQGQTGQHWNDNVFYLDDGNKFWLIAMYYTINT